MADRYGAFVAALVFAGAMQLPMRAHAQEARAMNLTQIERLFAAGVNATQILQTAREACIDFRIDTAAEQRLTRAGANAEFLTSLRQVCFRGAPPPVQPQPQPQPQPQVQPPRPATPRPDYNPGSAMTRSLLVPGLGQFYTGRPALGALFMAAWGGALGLGVLTQEVTIECLERVTGTCPSDQVRGEVTRRPMLMVGVGGAVAVAVISALEASSAAKRANRRAGGDGAMNALNTSAIMPSIRMQPGGAVALGLRVRVW